VQSPSPASPTVVAMPDPKPKMKTFVRVAEIWVPTKDRMQLQFLDGLYGPLKEFRSVSEQMRFHFDEGLPGKAWSARHPIILKEFENSYFRRTEAAKLIGLTCGVALPVFVNDELTAVVVLFCGDDEAHVGAIELWHNDPDTAYEMMLVDGYYGSAEMFEFNSRYTKFPRGFGLPGRVWKSNMPLIVKDLYHSKTFLRWREAVEIGINRGLGIPYAHASGKTWVTTFLSARDTPIARRFEIWVPDAQGDTLILNSGDSDEDSRFAAGYQTVTISKSEGTIGQVWATGVPAVRDSLADDPSPAAQSAIAAGLSAMVAMPVSADGGHVKAVVAWYL
jgi:hypothetical protein